MHIKRFYTHAQDNWTSDSIYNNVKFKLADAIIRSSSGEIIQQIDNVEVPAEWSQSACDIYASKYIRKAGVPNKTQRIAEENVPVWLQKSIPANESVLGRETSIKQTINRLVGCWTYHGWLNGYFQSEEEAQIFFDEIRYMMINQICVPNSPQWFNTGLHWAYGITGRSGNQYHYDRILKQIAKSQNAYEHPQVHACFILEVLDDLINKNGIMDTAMTEASIFKYGSGAGANFSNIRGSNEKLSGGGQSSGLLSFLDVINKSAGAIKSGGTTRRAAKMVILDDDHPDLVEFIMWKVKEEAKVLSLAVGSEAIDRHVKNIVHSCQQYSGDESDKYDSNTNLALKIAIADAEQHGVPSSYCQHVIHALESGIPVNWEVFNLDWNGAGYRTVSGQNSNNSIRITDKFMHAVENDAEWHLIARTDGSIVKTLKARKLWDLICYSAWACADPGVQYNDTIQSWHTCKASGPIRGTNPCSEYVFLDNTACNLASINLDKMLTHTANNILFNTDAFQYVSNLWTLVLDISVTMAQYPTYDFAERSLQYRTLGLGYGSMGSMLMSLGIAYDSDEGRSVAASITAMLTLSVYNTSSHLAKTLGAFEKYEENKESMLNIIENMHHLVHNQAEKCKGLNTKPYLISLPESFKYLGQATKKLSEETFKNAKAHGVRNAQATVIAPTGTIGFIMDFSTWSIEPAFALVSWKKLAGGGDMRVLNNTVSDALHALKYTDAQIADMKHYISGHGNMKHAPHINNSTLKAKGFSDEMIDKMTHSLKSAYDIKHIINVNFFGQEILQKRCEININAGDILLEVLGFTAEQIHEANIYCCGHLSIEGAPHLKPEHINVFDCAMPNGVGSRFISPEGHYKMVAAVQPFISGAASKTVNLPEHITIDEISKIYFETWKYGIKCVSLYRNNSKLSQPMNTTNLNNKQSAKQNKEVSGKRYGMRIDNQAFYILTQDNEQGLLTEIDIVMGKEGSSYRTLMDCFAQAISLGLKYNIPLSKYVEAFKNTGFDPAGIVTGYPGIDRALSPLDLLARVLEKEYILKNKDTHMKTFDMLQIGSVCNTRKARAIIEGHEFKLFATEIIEAGQPRLAEVFFKMSKEGSAFCSLMSNFGKAISIALRARVPFEVIYNTFIGVQFAPYGYITGDPYIRRAESLIDYAFQCLGRWYLPNVRVQSSNLSTFDYSTEMSSKFADSGSKTYNSSQNNASQNACSKCFSFSLKQNGSCLVCSNCGETTGCS